MILTKASNQWAHRPDDERFTNLDDLLDHARHQRRISEATIVGRHDILARPIIDEGGRLIDDHGAGSSDFTGLAITGVHDEPVFPSHWSFGQLCGMAKAPAGYLRTLTPDLAADNLNYSLRQQRSESAGVLTRHNGESTLAAATGPGYGRIWNDEITAALIRRFGNGTDGDFTVPGEFGRKVEVSKANTTLYASDRDMFVFLADETNRIEVPDRRHGEPGMLARGFFLWNSEVGSQTLGISTFLFDYVCMNRIVWGAQDVQEIRIRHSPNAPHRWLDDIVPALENYAQKDTRSITDAISNARSHRLDEEQVTKVLVERFTKDQATGIRLAFRADEDRPIETAWDMVVGATAYARNITHQNDRVAIERVAGKILTSASR